MYLRRQQLVLFFLLFAFSVLATNGGYSDWSAWTHCSATCGNGHRTRDRSCTNPPPGLYGNDCSYFGRENQTAECNSGDVCPDLRKNNQTAKCNDTSCEGIIYGYNTVSFILSRFQFNSCPLTENIATAIIIFCRQSVDKVKRTLREITCFFIDCCVVFWATSSSRPN